MSNARMNNTESEWKNIDWRKLEIYVFKLQNRIFKASKRGDEKVVRHIQKTLMRSRAAKVIAIRRVTQDNQGKNTAGVDGKKALQPRERMTLISQINLTQKPQPTRRVWIPKPGTDEKRPLGIPTIRDRATQALTKMALEPQWEARFESGSYGFRPGRSTHDAIGAIFQSICMKPKYALDADIAQCFDRIDHDALLRKVNTFPTLRKLLKRWLKAGVMEKDALHPTEKGTPQGGVISPLLANIALHGMEDYILSHYPKRTVKTDGKVRYTSAAQLIRYADDFVILHDDLSVILHCQELIADWLKQIGLELKATKTRITHTLHEHEGNKGFDFLGFTVRQFPTKKRNANGDQGKGYITLIKPSKKAIKRHYERINLIIKSHTAHAQWRLIEDLNPVIRGWSNYYSAVVSKVAFSKLDDLLYKRLKRWAFRRHPRKPRKWIRFKYWHLIDSKKSKLEEKSKRLVFESRGLELTKHADTMIVRHTKVQSQRSPYDGDWVYWSTRRGKYPGVSNRFSRMMKFQKGQCTLCRLYFKAGDVIELDHKIPRYQGGKDEMKNIQLVHRHCHDLKSAKDLKDNPLGNIKRNTVLRSRVR